MYGLCSSVQSEQSSIKTASHRPLDKRQDLYPWEKELLMFFSGCDLMIRRRFTGMLQSQDRTTVERSLAAAEKLAQLPQEELAAIEKILDAITGSRSP